LARFGLFEYRRNMATQSKTELLQNLRGMVRDMLKLRSEGGAYAKLARAHGYVDGYMRVLLETEVAGHKELLALVSDERRKFEGPSIKELTESDLADAPEHTSSRIVAA
jgi:hypothetical protein